MQHELDRRTGLIPVAEGPSDQMDSLALVLESVGILHRYDPEGNRLLVAIDDAPAALFHLDQYRRENLHWPPKPPPMPAQSPLVQPTVVTMVLLALFFAHTGSWSPDTVWFARGALDSAAILDQGQWWRLLTALTLHAGPAHLLGNCLIGGVIIHLLGRLIGYGQCWLLLIFTGALGNLVNILFRQQPHLSVGFSTSVFAAIGLLTGLQMARFGRQFHRGFLLPLGAGAGLLAFLGVEGVRTDLGAHLFGCVCGFCCGWLGQWSGCIARLRSPGWQAPLFILALLILVIAWIRMLP